MLHAVKQSQFPLSKARVIKKPKRLRALWVSMIVLDTPLGSRAQRVIPLLPFVKYPLLGRLLALKSMDIAMLFNMYIHQL